MKYKHCHLMLKLKSCLDLEFEKNYNFDDSANTENLKLLFCLAIWKKSFLCHNKLTLNTDYKSIQKIKFKSGVALLKLGSWAPCNPPRSWEAI